MQNLVEIYLKIKFLTNKNNYYSKKKHFACFVLDFFKIVAVSMFFDADETFDTFESYETFESLITSENIHF